MPVRLSMTGSQSEYNKFVKDADLFVLPAYSKPGLYTDEEFENAFANLNQRRSCLFLLTSKSTFKWLKETFNNMPVPQAAIKFSER